jgi:hypothetical protein
MALLLPGSCIEYRGEPSSMQHYLGLIETQGRKSCTAPPPP